MLSLRVWMGCLSLSLGFLATFSKPAVAQTGDSATVDYARPTNFFDVSKGNFTHSIIHPTDEEGRLFCNYGDSSCQPLNLDSCSQNGRPLSLQIYRNNVSIPSISQCGSSDVLLVAWLQKSNSVCTWTESSDETLLIGQKVNINSSSFLSGSGGLNLPSDVNLDSFTTTDILNQLGACPQSDGTGGIPPSVYRLCLGINPRGDGIVKPDGTSGASTTCPDLSIGFLLPISTQRPPEPGDITTTSLKKRCQLSIPVTSAGSRVYQVKIYKAPENNALDANCVGWPEAPKVINVASSANSIETELSGDNGTNYSYCVKTVDPLGNESAQASLASCIPHDECDLFECFPDDAKLKTGFCSSAPTADMSIFFVLMYLHKRWSAGRRKHR